MKLHDCFPYRKVINSKTTYTIKRIVIWGKLVKQTIPDPTGLDYIAQNILPALPEKSREEAAGRAVNMLHLYVGMEEEALTVMQKAAEQGRFDEFLGELEHHYDISLQYVQPELRKVEMPATIRAQEFFRHCYEALEH